MSSHESNKTLTFTLQLSKFGQNCANFSKNLLKIHKIDQIHPNSVPLEEIRSWAESFDRLMKCNDGRKVFQDFLRCEYSEENILFWTACEELKAERDSKMIAIKARDIYEDYISILSSKEVGVRVWLALLVHLSFSLVFEVKSILFILSILFINVPPLMYKKNHKEKPTSAND